MSPPRKRMPTDPVRWIHHRIGDDPARKRQHVVASSGHHGRFTMLLCGHELSDGRFGFGPGHPRNERWGPRSAKPIVTLEPEEGIPLCFECVRILHRLGVLTS